MALNKQLVPIALYKGVSTKNDDKASVPGDLRALENGVFTNPGKIRKRNGFTSLPTNSSSGNVSIGKAISSYNDEPLIFTDNQVLGFSETQNSWINRGSDYSLTSSTKSIVNNNSQQKNPEVCISNGYEVYAWEDSGGGVRYSVIDHTNGSVLVSEGLVDFFAYRPKIVFWQNRFQITYVASNQIYIRNIDPNTPFIISQGYVFAPGSLANHISTDGPQYDVAVDDGYGNFYIALSNSGGLTTLSTVAFDGTTYSSAINITTVADSSLSLGIFIDSLELVWVLCSGTTGFQVGGVFTNQLAPTVTQFLLSSSQSVNRCMGYQNSSSGDIVVFYEIQQPLDIATNYGNLIYKANISTDKTVLSNKIFKRGFGLYSKAFNSGNEYFFTLTFDAPFQSTYYLFSENGTIVDRSNVNNGGGNKNASNDGFPCGMCTNAVNPDSGVFYIPEQIKTSIQSNNNTTYLPTGINVAIFDFNSRSVFGNVFTSGNLNVAGGILKNYDGINYVENNFLVYPEGIQVFNDPLTTNILTPGSTVGAGVAEVIDFNMLNGWQFIPNSYITFSSTLFDYFAWFRINGVGTAPLASGVGIPVDINSTDTKEQVALALGIALTGVTDFGVGITENTVILTNNAVGPSLSAPTTGNVNSGSLGVGDYLYSVIYSWVDNNGVIQRSETSVPISASVGVANSNVALVIPTLRISEKSNVRIDIYRTEGTNFGSDIFYRVSPTGGIPNDPSVDFVSFVDNIADTDILANDLLYTTGGVLDNTAPPASSMIALYKNRVFIGGLEDKNLLWFSKYVFEGIPVQFSEFLTFKCDPRGGDITALGVLDDKLIIFKKTCMFVLVGNGPTDTGQQNDYDSGAVSISADVGCVNTNSVVITPNGLMFQSTKGIYTLNRGLATEYSGADVEAYNGLTITSAVLSPNNNQVRFTTSDGPILVYDYYVNQWSVFTNLEAASAHFINQTYYLLRATGIVLKEDQSIFTDDGKYISLKIKTGWITMAGVQGYQRIWRVSVLGSYRGPHTLQLSFAYDYSNSDKAFTQIDAFTLIGDNEPWGSDGYWGEIGTVWGGSYVPYEFRTHLTYQKCTAIQITIQDLETQDFNEGYDLSNINLEIGVKKGANKLPGKNSFGNS